MSHSPAPDIATPQDPWADRRRRIRSQLQRAMYWQEALKGGLYHSQSEVASQEGLSRARVSQIMKLLSLGEEIKDHILDEQIGGPLPTEGQLRTIAGYPSNAQQNTRLKKLMDTLEKPRVTSTSKAQRPQGRSRQMGFQHLFTQARQFRVLFDSGDFRTLEEIGREVGVTGTRVGQLLNLLYLDPEMIALFDVQADKGPRGFTTKDLRAIARQQDSDGQWAMFETIQSRIRLKAQDTSR